MTDLALALAGIGIAFVIAYGIVHFWPYTLAFGALWLTARYLDARS